MNGEFPPAFPSALRSSHTFLVRLASSTTARATRCHQLVLGDEVSRVLEKQHERLEDLGREGKDLSVPNQTPFGRLEPKGAELIGVAGRMRHREAGTTDSNPGGIFAALGGGVMLMAPARRVYCFALLVMLSAAVAGAQGVLLENFDGVTPPAFPAGWVATNAQGQNPLWVTAASGEAYTAPNSAFVSAGGVVDEARVAARCDRDQFRRAPVSARVCFFVDPGALTESIPVGFGTLEISIAGGGFQGITTAGGSFVTGGPGDGSSTWTSQNAFPPACCTAVIVNFPAAAAGTNIVLRWRLTSTMGPNAPGAASGGSTRSRFATAAHAIPSLGR